MSRFSKLLNNILNGIPDEKSNESIWDQPATVQDDYIGNGFARLKDLWDKTTSADGHKETPDSSITLSQLLRQHNAQNRLLKEHYDRFRDCKCILVANEFRRKLDSTVQQAYFGGGGIRFFARILQEHVKNLDPDRQETSDMVVSCYNSAIIPMMDRRQSMEKKCAVLEQEICNSKKLLAESAALYHAMGYTPCGIRLNDLKQQISDGCCDDLPAELKNLKKTLDDNYKALEKMLNLSDPMPEPAPLKNAPLRADLADLLNEEKLKSLSTPMGFTPEEYALQIRSFLAELENRLLNRYLLPGETGAAKEGN